MNLLRCVAQTSIHLGFPNYSLGICRYGHDPVHCHVVLWLHSLRHCVRTCIHVDIHDYPDFHVILDQSDQAICPFSRGHYRRTRTYLNSYYSLGRQPMTYMNMITGGPVYYWVEHVEKNSTFPDGSSGRDMVLYAPKMYHILWKTIPIHERRIISCPSGLEINRLSQWWLEHKSESKASATTPLSGHLALITDQESQHFTTDNHDLNAQFCFWLSVGRTCCRTCVNYMKVSIYFKDQFWNYIFIILDLHFSLLLGIISDLNFMCYRGN